MVNKQADMMDVYLILTYRTEEIRNIFLWYILVVFEGKTM
jgi:hypothetical protein